MLQSLKQRYAPPSGEGALFTVGALWALIIPLIIDQTLTSLMGIADTLMVSGLGAAAISGVTCADVVNVLVLRVFEACGAGGNVVCAKCVGARDTRGAKNVSFQFIAFQLLLSAVITCAMTLFCRQLISLLYPTLEADVAECMRVYFRITILSYPFLALYTASAAIYRANGNSKLPVTVVSVGNVLNILGNAFFIYVIPVGIAGVAWSTFFSRVFSCAVLLFLQVRKGQPLSPEGMHSFHFEGAVILDVLKIGFPAALESGMFQLGKVFVQASVAVLGTSAIAAQAIIAQIDTFASRPVQAMGFALLTIVGQYKGAKRMDLAKQSTRYILFLSVLGNVVTAVLTQAAAPWVCSLVALPAETTALVIHIVLFTNISRVLVWSRAFQLPYAFKAAGDVDVPVLMTMASMWIVRVGGGYLLGQLFDIGLWGIWFAWVGDWVVRTVLFSIRFNRMKADPPGAPAEAV